jgi:hypothetical protein
MTSAIARTTVNEATRRDEGCRALFVTHGRALSDVPGGLQICTREYRETLAAAGFALSDVIVEHDRRISTRLRQRLSFNRYPAQWRPSAVRTIAAEASRVNAGVVFLNLVNLAPLAAALRPVLDRGRRIVLLSHGLESTDLLHALRARAGKPPRWSRLALGRTLLQEARQRRYLDHVFCLSPFDAEMEHWLGAHGVTWLPRTIPQRAPLSWLPRPGRVGFVGTLDHQPNADGLAAWLEAIAPRVTTDLSVRIVGGPRPAGEQIARRWPFVAYLGPLDDRALEAEASTWSCVVHPLFCYARGCSTKLAIAIAWQIPVATTPAGHRGYVWSDGVLPVAETPDALAALTMELSRPDRAARVRPDIALIASTAPRLADVAALIHGALLPPVGVAV